MTVLKRISSWYNPLYVEHGDRAYELNAIKVYNNDGVIVSGGGWFGSNSNIANALEINGETKKVNRDKLNYNSKYNLIVKEDQPGYKSNIVYTLYINSDNIKLIDEGIESNGLYIQRNYKSALYSEIFFKKILLFKHEYIVREDLQEVKKKLNNLYGNSSEDGSAFNEIIDDLNMIKEKANTGNLIYKMLNKEKYCEMYERGGYREREIMDNCRSWRVFEAENACIEFYNNETNRKYNITGVYDLIKGVWIN